MKRSLVASTLPCLLAIAALAGAQEAANPAATPKAKPRQYIGGVADTGQFLPDTTVIATVEGRTIRVWDFRESYFSSFAEYRPLGNAAGRREFFESMINKEVLALTALEINKPMDFEDRATLREHTDRVMSNMSFQRLVRDSAVVSEDDIRRVHKQLGTIRKLQHVQFEPRDMALARRVHSELRSKKLKWQDAVARHTIAKNDSGPEGTMGWITRDKIPDPIAEPIWKLPVGGITSPIRDIDGIHIYRAVEDRQTPPIHYGIARTLILAQLQPWAVNQRVEMLRDRLRAQMGMKYDTTNIVWASSLFGQTSLVQRGPAGETVINAGGDVPAFQPNDTSRVLATWKDGGVFTLGRFLTLYNSIQVLHRQNVNNFDDFRGTVDSWVMDPYFVQMARDRGYDKDPMAIAQIERKREQLLVEHLFEDSVEARVMVTPQQRHAYYERHQPDFHSWRHVTYAAIYRPTRAGADSVAGRIRAGESPAAILAADSAAGFHSGSIRSNREDDRGIPYYKVLFEELKQGDTQVIGPDRQGDFMVLHSIEYDQGHPLSYQEVEHLVDESVTNIAAEELLKGVIARHRTRYRITARPELLDRIKLSDPLLD